MNGVLSITAPNAGMPQGGRRRMVKDETHAHYAGEYAEAREKADKASANAKGLLGHLRAAKLHDQAYRVAAKTFGTHSREVAYHSDRSSHHTDQALHAAYHPSLKLSTDLSVTGDSNPEGINQWTTTGASSKKEGKVITRLDKEGKLLAPEIQARMSALGVRPGWTDVRLASDPSAELQAQGTDKSGKVQSIYSKEHNERKANEKFERLKAFEAARPALVAQAEKDWAKGDDTAATVCLINATGFRVGSTEQLGKEVVFGVTTLEGQHVKVEGDKVSFHFPGKGGTDIQHEVVDTRLAKDIAERQAKVGPTGKLFATNDDRVLNYIKAVTGNPHFKTHDFLTWHATSAARLLIARDPKIREDGELTRFQASVTRQVGEHLHDSPTVVRSFYIDPKVWSPVLGVR